MLYSLTCTVHDRIIQYLVEQVGCNRVMLGVIGDISFPCPDRLFEGGTFLKAALFGKDSHKKLSKL